MTTQSLRVLALLVMALLTALLPSEVPKASPTPSQVEIGIDPPELLMEKLFENGRFDDWMQHFDQLKNKTEVGKQRHDQLIKELEEFESPFPGRHYEPPWIY
jgi:hypothetical protein